MTFNPAIWYPIAAVLSVINLAAAGFAAGQAEPWHATIHAALAVAFGLWAQRLRQAPRGSEPQARLEALEAEMGNLRQELSETQERLDFAERMLAQGPEARRVDPQR
jgi:predicted outer membrane protein